MYLLICFVQANWQNNIIRNFFFVSVEIWNKLWLLLLCSVALHMRMTILRQFKKCLYCLGAFAKLRKVIISFVICDCLSVRPSIGPHRIARTPLTYFHEISYLNIFQNLSRIFKFINILQKWRALYMEKLSTFMTISRSFLLRMRNVLDEIVNTKSHFMFNIFFF